MVVRLRLVLRCGNAVEKQDEGLAFPLGVEGHPLARGRIGVSVRVRVRVRATATYKAQG